jgi:signal transduction histidine kinase
MIPDDFSAGAGSADQATILLVDDDPAILEGVADFLRLYGYHVITAVNGYDGLRKMQSRTPELVISDIMMPEMNGYEFYEAVRSNPAWVPIPFIFLTARGQQTDVRRGHDLGADAYLTKPFEPEDLITAVGGRLRRMRDIRSATTSDVEQMKRQLITIFSHELRTPLTYIYGYVNLLLDQHGELAPDATFEMLEGVRKGAERLLRLVDDLMLMVRIDSGVVEMEISLEQIKMSMVEIVTSVVRDYEARAAARGVRLFTMISPELEPLCMSYYLRDALGRLVDNAIKFSKRDRGHVLVSVDHQDSLIRLSVRDDGIGIEPSQIGTIFELFKQVNRDVMEQQGTGLGLTLAMSLVRLQGGDILVESVPGQGSQFTIQLPADRYMPGSGGRCT